MRRVGLASGAIGFVAGLLLAGMGCGLCRTDKGLVPGVYRGDDGVQAEVTEDGIELAQRVPGSDEVVRVRYRFVGTVVFW
ncbi:MAG: hypothetical protein H6732_13075 [Alphaproteobacteria bacterium]|nr:hypothetical protein [Alphaproteobacteria bacterium]